MGCAFCASTIAGRVRDLAPSEMLDQVLFTQMDSGREISNIVLMGIGEPLDNRDNVLKFLGLVNHPDGMHIGMRHVNLRRDSAHRVFSAAASAADTFCVTPCAGFGDEIPHYAGKPKV